MRSNNDTRKKRFLALLLSALMVSSTAAFAACNADDDSSSSSSSSSTEEVTKADNAPIKNGGFETFDKKDGKNLIGTSVSSWTRSDKFRSERQRAFLQIGKRYHRHDGRGLGRTHHDGAYG